MPLGAKNIYLYFLIVVIILINKDLPIKVAALYLKAAILQLLHLGAATLKLLYLGVSYFIALIPRGKLFYSSYT